MMKKFYVMLNDGGYIEVYAQSMAEAMTIFKIHYKHLDIFAVMMQKAFEKQCEKSEEGLFRIAVIRNISGTASRFRRWKAPGLKPRLQRSRGIRKASRRPRPAPACISTILWVRLRPAACQWSSRFCHSWKVPSARMPCHRPRHPVSGSLFPAPARPTP